MAIGAIEALQTYGYNKEDKSKKSYTIHKNELLYNDCMQ